MTRRYATMTPKEVAAEREWGIFEAKKQVNVSKMLDRLEKPTFDKQGTGTAVLEMRDVLIEFIKMQTGVE